MKVSILDLDSRVLMDLDLSSIPEYNDEIWFGDPIEEYRIFRKEWHLNNTDGPEIQLWVIQNDQP